MPATLEGPLPVHRMRPPETAIRRGCSGWIETLRTLRPRRRVSRLGQQRSWQGTRKFSPATGWPLGALGRCLCRHLPRPRQKGGTTPRPSLSVPGLSWSPAHQTRRQIKRFPAAPTRAPHPPGAETWRRILNAIERLQATKPAEALCEKSGSSCGLRTQRTL
jgi:hypothetical protein